MPGFCLLRDKLYVPDEKEGPEMVRKALRVTLVAAAIFASISFAGGGNASADPCLGTWTIGMGGLNDNTSSVFPHVNQRVGYNSWDPVSGIRELNRLVYQHRSQCGGDHIKLIGHSEGAALVHVWVTEHQNFPNANAILLSDPKRVAGPGNAGLSSLGGFLGYPLAGVDNWFGAFPVLTVCNGNDIVCNTGTTPVGYVSGAHQGYDFNPNHYSDVARGVWFR